MKPIYIFFSGVVILIILTALLSCHTRVQKSETRLVDDHSSTVDSLNKVIKTWSDSYEELLKSASSTGVVFETSPCDSGKVGGAGMPHVIIRPDGTKEFSGPIKSYKDDQTLSSKISQARQLIIDSMNSLHKTDTTHHEATTKTLSRTVKVTVFPWWLIVGALVFTALWLNERFNLFKIPFLTKK